MQIAVVAETKAQAITNRRDATPVVSFALLEGPKGPSSFHLDYLELAPDYGVPRHRHNFDQIRWVLEGRWAVDRKRFVGPGEIGYFPEGASYEGVNGERTRAILIQFGTPSLNGALTSAEVQAGREALAKVGQFHEGIFTVVDKAGKRHNSDSFEAIWEHYHGRKVEYLNPPRYSEPIVINPGAFKSTRVEGGVTTKHLGTFSEACCSLSLIDAEVGSSVSLGQDHTQVAAVLSTGTIKDDKRSYPGVAAIHLMPGEKVNFQVVEPSQILELNLPDLTHQLKMAR